MVNHLWDNLFKRQPYDQDIEGALHENYIFKILSPSELKFMRSLVHRRTYKPTENIFVQGEIGVGMYIVLKGTVNISVEDLHERDEAQKNVFVTRLSRGDFFGELSLVENSSRRTATATAAEDVVLLGFFKPDLNEIIERSPGTAIKILSRLGEVLGRRLKETADSFAEVKRELKELTSSNGKN